MNKWIERLAAPAIVALLVAGASHASVYQWSHTAASNATADATINWSEGMSPSSVNDSARAMMARVADWRDDFSGLLATGGTSTAYTVATNQGLTATPTNGQLISVTPHATNGASATLSADSGTAFPIQTAPGTAVAAGVLVSGTPYDLKFSSSASAWILKNFYANPFSVPLGAVLDYTAATAPNSNFVLANGQCISRTTYASYFSLVGTTYGACDGTTTFGVPDLANRIVAGAQMGGTARITVAGGNFDGNTLGAAGGLQNHTQTIAEMPVHTPTGTTVPFQSAGVIQPSTYTPLGVVGIVDPAHAHSVNNGTGVIHTGGGTQLPGGAAGSVSDITVNAALTGITANFTGTPQAFTYTGNFQQIVLAISAIGSGNAFSVMPPTMVLSKIVRIF